MSVHIWLAPQGLDEAQNGPTLTEEIGQPINLKWYFEANSQSELLDNASMLDVSFDKQKTTFTAYNMRENGFSLRVRKNPYFNLFYSTLDLESVLFYGKGIRGLL